MKTMTSLLGRQTMLDFKKILTHQFFHPNASFYQVIAKLKKVGFFWYTLPLTQQEEVIMTSRPVGQKGHCFLVVNENLNREKTKQL